MHTQNVNVKTATPESPKTWSKNTKFTILVAEIMPGEEEWDVMVFASINNLQKLRRACPEKMKGRYHYVVSRGVNKAGQHINVVEADHLKQFVREIKRLGIPV